MSFVKRTKSWNPWKDQSKNWTTCGLRVTVWTLRTYIIYMHTFHLTIFNFYKFAPSWRGIHIDTLSYNFKTTKEYLPSAKLPLINSYTPQGPSCNTRRLRRFSHASRRSSHDDLYVFLSAPQTAAPGATAGHSVRHWHRAGPSSLKTQSAPHLQMIFSQGSANKNKHDI